MVVTNDERYYERLRLLRSLRERRKYEDVLKGWNSRLDEMRVIRIIIIRVIRICAS
jgi:dTDP-4-amino-4,6-dideoxygalactose transaminase